MLEKLFSQKREANNKLIVSTAQYYEQYKAERMDNNITDTLAHLKTTLFYEDMKKAETEAEIIDFRIKAYIQGKS